MRRRLLPVLVTGVLALSLLGPVTAVADEPDPAGPSLPAQAAAAAEEHAEEVLEEAQVVFEERSPASARRLLADGGLDATMTLNMLLRVRDDLSPSERRRADALLARPTDGRSDPMGDGYGVREAKPLCGGVICVHYVRRTKDAPPRADRDRDRVPNAVEDTLKVSRYVHGTYIRSGYRRPDSDGRRGGRRRKVDIYLANTGAQGYYGYCTTDRWRGTAKNRSAYCVVDDDFAEFVTRDTTARENRQVTLAHEYFHAVQFAYDAFEDAWFMEATAAWVEDEVFDRVNDNLQYVPEGQLRDHWVPLDRFTQNGGNHYGNWIFFRYLTERWNAQTGSLPNLVLEMWRDVSGRRGAADLYSTSAIQAALAGRGSSFTDAYGDFAAANRDPGWTYEEGAAYARHTYEPIVRTLSSVTPRVSEKLTLDHLTADTVRFQPADELDEPGWSLQLVVDMVDAGAAPGARVVVHHADGAPTTSPLSPSDGETRTATVPFSAGEITNVELVLVNASRRMRCWRGSVYACRGWSLDDGRRWAYDATVVPPGAARSRG